MVLTRKSPDFFPQLADRAVIELQLSVSFLALGYMVQLSLSLSLSRYSRGEVWRRSVCGCGLRRSGAEEMELVVLG